MLIIFLQAGFVSVTLLLFFMFSGLSSEITVTQSPGSQSVVPEQTVSITCRTSTSVSNDVGWYVQKPGEAPKLLIDDATSRWSGVPDRFSGSGSDPVSRQVAHYSGSNYYLAWYHHKTGEAPKRLIDRTSYRYSGISSRLSGSGAGNGLDFTLTISGVQAEDSGVYYCQSYHSSNFVSLWWTFGGGTRLDVNSDWCLLGDVHPSLTVLPPSREELQQGKATLMCLANKGFPSDWSLSWKVDGSSSSSSSISSSWEESRSPGVLQEDGLYSWSSTLRLPADQWRKVGSVSCEATQGSQTPLSETLRRDQCSQS
uniref:Ig-like domain-containing protein n=1 Tax=Amphiprion ocellaris TaxID=80972 RepID=A0AAQ5YVV5_AMPOC